MTTPHRTLQMALDALDNLGSMSDKDVTPYAWRAAKAEAACTALREALAAPEPEPVGAVYTMEALVPGGDLRCHATLHKALPAGTKLYAAPPAAPAPVAPVPDGWVMVPKEATREMCVAAVILNNGNAVYKNVAAEALEIEEQIYGEVWSAMIAASPAAPVVPLTDEQFADIVADASLAVDFAANPIKLLAFAREVLKAHDIGGGNG